MTATTHPAPRRHTVGLGALWFGLLGAPAAWSVQELASYAVVAHACFPSWQPYALPTIPGTWTIAVVVSLLMIAVALAGVVTAWRSWGRTEPRTVRSGFHQAEVGEGRTQFMAFSGLLVSGMVLYTMVLNFLMLFLVPPCG
jgi:hypothetical protein